MFRAIRRSSSGAPIVFTASGLHTHVVIAHSQVWVGTQTWLRAVTTKPVPTQTWLRAVTTKPVPTQTWLRAVTTKPVPTQTWLWAITTCVCKPEAVNTVGGFWWWATYRSKHVEHLMYCGIINSVTKVHIVGYCYWVTHFMFSNFFLKMLPFMRYCGKSL